MFYMNLKPLKTMIILLTHYIKLLTIIWKKSADLSVKNSANIGFNRGWIPPCEDPITCRPLCLTIFVPANLLSENPLCNIDQLIVVPK